MKNAEIVKEFFRRRFKREPESDKYYFQEWVERFNSGHPESWMDSESLKVWERLKGDKR